MDATERLLVLPLVGALRAMRYRVEYLADPENVYSVCHIKVLDELTEAERQAWMGASGAGRLFGARAFHIRDMDEDGEVVSTGKFDTTN
jgi:hypothetical protein